MRWGAGTINVNRQRTLPAGRLLAYPAAVVLVAAAGIATFLLWHPLFSRNPHALFYAAVVVAAWSGGIGPGLLASAAGVFLIDYLFTPSFANEISDLLTQFIAFAIISLLVSW